MIIGIPKEIKNNEKRVSLTPFGAEELISLGHIVYLQKNAGLGSGFPDNMYVQYGVKTIENIEDVYLKSDLIVKVKEPEPEEIKLIKENHLIFTFFHFAANTELTKGIIKSKSALLRWFRPWERTDPRWGMSLP